MQLQRSVLYNILNFFYTKHAHLESITNLQNTYQFLETSKLMSHLQYSKTFPDLNITVYKREGLLLNILKK